MKESRYFTEFWHEELSLQWGFDTISCRIPPIFFRVDQYSDFIVINTENAISYKYVI